jgi:hypothetical protein
MAEVADVRCRLTVPVEPHQAAVDSVEVAADHQVDSAVEVAVVMPQPLATALAETLVIRTQEADTTGTEN